MLGSLLVFGKKAMAQTLKRNQVEDKSRAEIITMALNLIDWDDNDYPVFDYTLTRILANKNDIYVSFRPTDIIYVPKSSVVNSGTSVNLINGQITNSTQSSFPPRKAGDKIVKHKIALSIDIDEKNLAIEAVAKSREQSVEELNHHINSLFPKISLTIKDMGDYYTVSEYMQDSYEWSYSLNKSTGEMFDDFSATMALMPTMEEGGHSDDYTYMEIKSLKSEPKRDKTVPKGIGCKKR